MPSTGPDSQRPLSPGLLSSFLQKERIREKFVEALKTEFAGKGLRFSRGMSTHEGPEGPGAVALLHSDLPLCPLPQAEQGQVQPKPPGTLCHRPPLLRT